MKTKTQLKRLFDLNIPLFWGGEQIKMIDFKSYYEHFFVHITQSSKEINVKLKNGTEFIRIRLIDIIATNNQYK